MKLNELQLIINYLNNGLPDIEIPITTHCNLNCAYCSYGAPISKKHYLDVDLYKKSINQLNKLISKVSTSFTILGGEPLLHPDIEKILNITRNTFKHETLDLITNGLLLPKMPESFWNNVKCNNVNVKITKYPNLNYDFIPLIEQKYNINIITHANRNIMNKYFVDITGSQNIQKSFQNCDSNCCFRFVDGKLYRCGGYVIQYIFDYFNINQNIKDYGTDVFSVNTFEELMEKVLIIPDVCKFGCSNKIPWFWKLSEKNIKEWT